MSDFPIVIGPAGLQPQSPASLNARLIALVTAARPGYTANLPGSLIEDISSTDTYALVVCDTAKVDLVNSLTPYGANSPLLTDLGNVYGVARGLDTNTSVSVVFVGAPGFTIPIGFTVSDGAHQYVVQDGAIIGAGGQTGFVFCVAAQPGIWSVPANTVTQIVTSVPDDIELSVSNPVAGTPGGGAQSEEDYRAQVLQAGLAAATGMASLLKTLLANVPGVQPRLVSVRQQPAGWEIIVGGGDPYQVAYAIYQADFWLPGLVGSTLNVTAITNANPGVVTTDLNHGYSNGQVINIAGVVGTSGVNNTPLTITVVSPTRFSIGINTTSSGAYVSGGVVTPNLRNQVVSIDSYPDTYAVPFVAPPQQTVGISLLWNTSSRDFVSPVAVATAGIPALAAYVNSVPAGVPLNLFEMQNAFQVATATLIPTALLTRMAFTVTIDGVEVDPEAGTGIIAGDPESFFETNAGLITITQG